MPRKHVPIVTDLPYHISARSNNRDWFSLPLPTIWKIMEDHLFFLHHAFGIKIHCFVLMNNHFHLIATCTSPNLSEAMNFFMKETSRNIAQMSGRINHVYGARYHKSLIRNDLYFSHAYKYVYRNPVEAEICSDVRDYPFSTLNGLVGLSKIIVPLECDDLLFNSPEQTLAWLNTAPDESDVEIIRRALKKAEFSIGQSRGGTAKPCRLFSNSY